MTNEHSTYDPHGHEPLPEGEEKAPPYTATMSIVRWVILGGMTLFAVVMLLNYFGLTPWSGGPAAVVQYHCPMHPTYISNQPGECPICGMTLVPMSGAGADSGKGTMADSAHDAGMPPHEAQPGQYVCPMHPEIISDQPGKCPKCGMNLELVPGEAQPAGLHEGQGHADASGASVPGLVPVTIEPQRLQLIGVRTGTVSRRALDGGLHRFRRRRRRVEPRRRRLGREVDGGDDAGDAVQHLLDARRARGAGHALEAELDPAQVRGRSGCGGRCRSDSGGE